MDGWIAGFPSRKLGIFFFATKCVLTVLQTNRIFRIVYKPAGA
jgi:hypothetical protein